MPFDVRCPYCGIQLGVDEQWVGLECECPQCRRKFVVPSPAAVPPGYRQIMPPPSRPGSAREAADDHDAYRIYNPIGTIVWSIFIPVLALWFLKRDYEELCDVDEVRRARIWFVTAVVLIVVGATAGFLDFLFMNAYASFTVLLNILIWISRIGGFGMWIWAMICSCRFVKIIRRDYSGSSIRYQSTWPAGALAILLVLLGSAASTAVILADHPDFVFVKIARKNILMAIGGYENVKSVETLQKLGEAAAKYSIDHYFPGMPDLQTLIDEGYYVVPPDSKAVPNDPADDIRNYSTVRNIRLGTELPDKTPVMFFSLRKTKGVKWSKAYGTFMKVGGGTYVLTMGNIRRHTPPALKKTDITEDMVSWALFPHHMDWSYWSSYRYRPGMICCANLLKLYDGLKHYAESRDGSRLTETRFRCPNTDCKYVLLDTARQLPASKWGRGSTACPVAYCPSLHTEYPRARESRLLVLYSDGMVVPRDKSYLLYLEADMQMRSKGVIRP